MKSLRNAWLAVGLVIGALAVVSAGYLLRPYQYQGSLIDPPVQSADFTLTDQRGQPFRLSAHQGKLLLVFFGYLNCPDVCPVTLTHYTQIQRALGEAGRDVEYVFVTVDPERDSAEALAAHLEAYSPDIFGLTGSEAELAPVWKQFGVYREKRETGSAAGYLMDHTSRVYLIDRQGNWRMTYPFEMDADLIIEDLQHLIREQ
jgi:protein SCO1/2